MKFFKITVFCSVRIIIFLAVMAGVNVQTAHARYELKNVYKAGGLNTQWMVIRGSRTVGSNVFEDSGSSSNFYPMIVSGDLINRPNVRRLYVTNGDGGDGSSQEIEKIFLTISKNESTNERQNQVAMTFYAPPTAAGAPVTPEVDIEWRDNRDFAIIKNNIQTEYPIQGNMTGRSFSFRFDDFTAWNYGSYIGNIKFQQSPSEEGNPSRDSQTQEIPLVLAYVYGFGADEREPLRFRTILKDNITKEIVGTNKFTWAVRNEESGGEGEKIIGNFDNATQGRDTQWVFTPLKSITDTESSNQYTLTTRIINRTGARYDTYNNSYRTTSLPASRWYFDVTPTTEYEALTDSFILDQRSHIAPGLATEYETAFALGQERINTVMWLDCVDPRGNGSLGLTVNYRNVNGVILGNTINGDLYTENSEPVPFHTLTAFIHRPIDTEFLTKVANAIKDDNQGEVKEISVRTTPGSFISKGNITNELNYDEIIRAFTLKKEIPADLRSNNHEALVPVLVTFNIPFGYRNTGTWINDMLKVWYQNGTNDDALVDEFLTHFSVGLLSSVNVDNTRRYCNLREELSLENFRDQIKIFMDEERRIMTVSFIVMLMDGTATEGKPTIRLVDDAGSNRRNSFMIVRDGKEDNEWNLTFYVAPAGFQPVNNTPNTEPTSDDVNNENNTPSSSGSGGGGGGGCNAGYASILGIMFIFAIQKFSSLKRGL